MGEERALFRRPTWSEVRELLDAEGFRPSKGRGQNFLLDGNVTRAIVRDAEVGEGDRVLEVGLGCGFLSGPLLDQGVELLGVEVEPRLVRVARRVLGDAPGLTLIEGDVLASKHQLAPAVTERLWREGPWHVVSNLPYSIAGPLLAVLARLENPPTSVTVLVQREVADRLTARPGEEAWGALTARLALGYRSRRLREVGHWLFWPRPRVESAVVRLVQRPGPALAPEEVRAYDELVAVLFRHRRRQLLPALKPLAGSRERAATLLEAVGLDPRARPSRLGRDELLALTRALGPSGGAAEGG